MSDWRLLIDPPQSGLENMATDEAILESCNRGHSLPTVRFYEWSDPTLSIGCFQKADNAIKCCLEAGIPYVRRITGGRAVLHFDEITYSIICCDNEPLFGEGISGAYRIISGCLLAALRDIGINADMHRSRAIEYGSEKISCFHSPSRYEIIIDNKKLVGSAQRRFKRAFIQHGSILFGIDRALIARLFGQDSLATMAWVEFYSNIKKHELRLVLADKIEKGLNIKLAVGSMNNNERDLREKLIQEKITNYDLRIKNSSPFTPLWRGTGGGK
ncbi:MAG: lipoate--protein ligase family protein [Deltaproteobacteria bacterium]|nr:lipoate--protein ligase family protein [Deltaproteobacteria bacterium]